MQEPPKLRAWFTGALNEVTSRGKYQRTALFHGSSDAPPLKLESYELRSPEGDPIDLEKLIESFLFIASQDADSHAQTGSGESQRYMACLYYADDDDEHPSACFPFTVRANVAPRTLTDSFAGSEPPTEKGITARLMQQNDVLARMVVSMYAPTHENLVRRLTDTERRLELYEQKALDNMVIYEALIDRRHERELQARHEEAREKRLDGIANHLKPFITHGLAQLRGGSAPTAESSSDVPADKASALGRAAYDFARTLTDEEMRAMFAGASPERREQLSRIFNLASEVEDAAKKGKAA